MTTQKNKGKPVRLPMAVWLGYLVVCTLLTGVIFSSYVTSASGGDSARVAGFDVVITKLDAQSDSLVIKKGQLHQSYGFSVINNSEVAVTYDVIVTLPSALPDGVRMSIDDGNIKPTVSNDQKVYTFSGVNFLSAGNSVEGTHELNFALDALDIYDRTDGYPTLSDIRVSVVVYQVD